LDLLSDVAERAPPALRVSRRVTAKVAVAGLPLVGTGDPREVTCFENADVRVARWDLSSFDHTAAIDMPALAAAIAELGSCMWLLAQHSIASSSPIS
jgi:hypothetical protein